MSDARSKKRKRKKDEPVSVMVAVRRDLLQYQPVQLAPGEYSLTAYHGPADGQRHKFAVDEDGDTRPQLINCIALLGTGQEPFPQVARGTYRPAYRTTAKGSQELCLKWSKDS